MNVNNVYIAVYTRSNVLLPTHTCDKSQKIYIQEIISCGQKFALKDDEYHEERLTRWICGGSHGLFRENYNCVTYYNGPLDTKENALEFITKLYTRYLTDGLISEYIVNVVNE